MINDIQQYYADTLIIQYHSRPKARATIKALIDLIYINMALIQMRDAFDWRTAVGVQLDIIGIWVGVTRQISKQLFDDHPWFSLIEISGATSILQGGYAEIDNFNTEEGGFLSPEYVNSYFVDLTDDNFRFLVGLKIIKNSISHTCKDIDDAIYNFDNGKIYTSWDLENGILTYYYPAEYEQIMDVALYKKVLPCPPTCTIQLEEISST